MIVLRANSHRARQKLERLCGKEYVRTNAYYNLKNLFHDKSKGYTLIEDSFIDDALKIKGITKARSQNIDDYAKCW